MLKTVCVYLALALGAGALFNGLFMLLDPWRWYLSVPGVTTTGLFNQHFIRDIGLIFLLLGGAFTLGAVRETYRVVLWSGVAVWLCGWPVMASALQITNEPTLFDPVNWTLAALYSSRPAPPEMFTLLNVTPWMSAFPSGRPHRML